MKQNMMFGDYLEVDQQSVASMAILGKIQRSLLIGLGAVLTFAVVAISSPEPFFDGFAVIFLLWMLFLAPAASGLVLLKFPSWQNTSIALRKNVILQSFGLSFLTLSTFIVFNYQWNRPMVDAMVTSYFVTFCYGLFMLWLVFHLRQMVEGEKGDLFP